MKILIAPNSFKECADSVKIATILASNISRCKNLRITSIPVSDGGDGFLNVCHKNFNLEKIKYKIPAPYGNKMITCNVGYSKSLKKMFIESADAVGLKLIPRSNRHPLHLNSRGLGVLLRKISSDIEERKIEVNRIKIGIGGTGTNDLGIGMLSELGMTLWDKNNSILKPIPINFSAAEKILFNKEKLPFKIDVITDVNNTLLGPEGASYVYGAQKGLSKKEIKLSDAGFKNILRISKKAGIVNSVDFVSGAGGGLAAGFQIYLKANLTFSDRFIIHDLGINKLHNYDAVVTAEGSFDKQSFMNKATGTIIKKFAGTKTKIFLVCGIIEKSIVKDLPSNVYPIELSKYFNNNEESIALYKKGLRLASEEIIENLL